MSVSTTAPAIAMPEGLSPPLWSGLGTGVGATSVVATEGVVGGEGDGGDVEGLVVGASVSVKLDSPVTGWPSLLTTRKATR